MSTKPVRLSVAVSTLAAAPEDDDNVWPVSWEYVIANAFMSNWDSRERYKYFYTGGQLPSWYLCKQIQKWRWGYYAGSK